MCGIVMYKKHRSIGAQAEDRKAVIVIKILTCYELPILANANTGTERSYQAG